SRIGRTPSPGPSARPPSWTWPSAQGQVAKHSTTNETATLVARRGRSRFLSRPRLDQEHPVVAPHVLHFMQVPFRTRVNWPQSGHGSPSYPFSLAIFAATDVGTRPVAAHPERAVAGDTWIEGLVAAAGAAGAAAVGGLEAPGAGS